MKLVVDKPVKREDGRHYVPIIRKGAGKPLSNTVARVASDAFPNLQEAIAFANLLTLFWNNGISFEGGISG